jgi:hypothetical protein
MLRTNIGKSSQTDCFCRAAVAQVVGGAVTDLLLPLAEPAAIGGGAAAEPEPEPSA